MPNLAIFQLYRGIQTHWT